jgi:hypothetical protein
MLQLGYLGGVEIVVLFGIAMAGLVVYLISREKSNTQNPAHTDNTNDIK